MIRSLHRRFLWNAFAIAAIFLLIVILIAEIASVRMVDDQLAGALHNTLRHPTAAFNGRNRLPSYLIEIQQPEPDPQATKLSEDDTVLFLRGDPSDWTGQPLPVTIDEMLHADDRIHTIPENTLCYRVERRDGIRIAAIDYEAYRHILHLVFLGSALLYIAILGALFLLMKLAEIRLLRPAERAWTNQERFVEDASHEMKTPLAVILSNAELGASDEPDETDRRFSMILSEAERMKLLITRMLETARIENIAAKRAHETVFSLSDAVTESALLFEVPLYEIGLTLTYEVEENLYVRADETLLKQVLRVLLENAGRYTPKGNAVSVTAKRRYRRAVITVRNEGIGIDKHERENIFERFYRADEVRTFALGSYGLGLSIAKNLIESMGGHIRCDSDGSNYTAFTVVMKLRKKQG